MAGPCEAVGREVEEQDGEREQRAQAGERGQRRAARGVRGGMQRRSGRDLRRGGGGMARAALMQGWMRARGDWLADVDVVKAQALQHGGDGGVGVLGGGVEDAVGERGLLEVGSGPWRG